MASKVFPIRLNEKEHQLLSDKASSCGKKPSTYLKSIAIHEAIGKRVTKKADAKLVMRLSNMSGTLNFMMLILNRELLSGNVRQQACELLHQDLFNISEELKQIGDRYDC